MCRPVLEGLEAANLRAELIAFAKVAERPLECLGRETMKLGSENCAPCIENGIENRCSLVDAAQHILCGHRDVVQFDRRCITAVDAVNTRDHHASRLGIDEKQRDPIATLDVTRGTGRNDQPISDMTVQDMELFTIELVFA